MKVHNVRTAKFNERLSEYKSASTRIANIMNAEVVHGPRPLEPTLEQIQTTFCDLNLITINYKIYATALQVHNIEYVFLKCLNRVSTVSMYRLQISNFVTIRHTFNYVS